MSAIYGYNVYCLEDYPRYPMYCPTYDDVEKIVNGDEDHYYVRLRTNPEDDDLLEDDDI